MIVHQDIVSRMTKLFLYFPKGLILRRTLPLFYNTGQYFFLVALSEIIIPTCYGVTVI